MTGATATDAEVAFAIKHFAHAHRRFNELKKAKKLVTKEDYATTAAERAAAKQHEEEDALNENSASALTMLNTIISGPSPTEQESIAALHQFALSMRKHKAGKLGKKEKGTHADRPCRPCSHARSRCCRFLFCCCVLRNAPPPPAFPAFAWICLLASASTRAQTQLMPLRALPWRRWPRPR